MHRGDEDFAREIESHLAHEIDRLIAGGVAPETARMLAHKRFGNVTGARERYHESRRLTWLEDTRKDVALALRSLRRNPGFAAAAIVTLALGIGANTAIFSLTDQILLQPLPVPRPHELVMLDSPGMYQGSTRGQQTFSEPMFRGLRGASAPVLSGMFARFGTGASVSTDGDAARVRIEAVSGDYFRTLGIDPTIGRVLGPDDDRTPDGHPVVVLSHAYWQNRFGGDPGVVGRSLRVNGFPMTIVGVAAPGFSGFDLGRPADLFAPLMMDSALTPTWKGLNDWRERWLHVSGRLLPGVTPERVAAVLEVTYRGLLEEDFKTVRARFSLEGRAEFLGKPLEVLPAAKGRSQLRTDFSSPLLALMAMVAVVLLIACVNVANLLMARASTQQQEVAVRLALGAGRFRLVRQRLTESLVLAGAGTLAGLAFAASATRLLIGMLPEDAGGSALSAAVDVRVVGFAVALALVTAIGFGLGPALRATGSRTAALRPGTGRVLGGGKRTRLLRVLVVGQVALSLLLVAGAGLFARSLYNLRSIDPGFITDRLLQLRVDAALNGYGGPQALVLAGRLRQELTAIAGVTAVSTATIPAMMNGFGFQTVRVQGYDPAAGEEMNSMINSVGPGYFATLGMALLQGRDFTDSDAEGGQRVAIVNEAMANRFWKGENPIGRRFGRQSETGAEIEVVGVVRDSRFANLRDDVRMSYYIPLAQSGPLDRFTFYVSHRAADAAIAPALRQAVARVDPRLPIYDFRTMESQIAESMYIERLVSWLSALFGLLALGLAAVGLYGVMSHAVAQRRREIGIRMALGAERSSVLWQMLRQVLVLAVAGVLIGLPAALGAGRLIESLLFGLAPRDPATIAAAVTVLIGVAMLAGYVPAMRATRVDPVVALREE
jgi:predicted permease